MSAYTLGQVLDEMEFGEVAVIVAGMSSGECPLENHDYLQTGVYFDEDERGVLKSLDGRMMTLSKTDDIERRSMFVIMPR